MDERMNKIKDFIENDNIPNKGRIFYMSRGVMVMNNNKNAIRVNKNQITLLNNIEMEVWKACKFGPRTTLDFTRLICKDHKDYSADMIAEAVCNLCERNLLYAEEARNATVAKILLMADFNTVIPKESFFKKMAVCSYAFNEYGFSNQFYQIISLIFFKQIFLTPAEYSLLCILKNNIPISDFIFSKKNNSLIKTDQEFIRENLIRYSQAYISLLRKLIIMTY